MTQLHIHYYFGYKNNGVLWIHTFYLKAITIKDKFIIYLFGDLFTLLLEEKTKKRIPKSTSKERRDVYKQFSGYEENILHLCKNLIERKSYYNFEKVFMKLNSLTLVIDLWTRGQNLIGIFSKLNFCQGFCTLNYWWRLSLEWRPSNKKSFIVHILGAVD